MMGMNFLQQNSFKSALSGGFKRRGALFIIAAVYIYYLQNPSHMLL